jgi:hypothetical protein
MVKEERSRIGWGKGPESAEPQLRILRPFLATSLLTA